tara:strand:+ start:343 stop:2517 length:2175 start_codon:yes stop_codon:yes gene_type:complete
MNHEMKNWCQEYFKKLCFYPPVVQGVPVPNVLFPPPAPLLPFLCGPQGVYNLYDSGHERQWRRQFAMFCNVVYGLWGTQMATRREVFEALKSLSDTMTHFPPIDNLVNPNNAIQENVFRDMVYLDIDWLPPSVWRIGVSAFEGCSGLRRLRLPERLHTIDSRAFFHCHNLVELDLPSTVSRLEAQAFAGCLRLRRLRLPVSVHQTALERIAGGLCLDCTQLERIDLPNSIHAIGGSAFRGCINLSAIGWSSNVQRIDQGAFFQCTNLAGKVTLPVRLDFLGEEAFRYCRQMTVIDQEQERGGRTPLWASRRVFADCSSLVRAPILRNLRTISAEAFKNCVSLVSSKQESLPFAAVLEQIRTEAFAGCTSLQYVHVPDGTREIQFSAFENCTNLAEIRLPENGRYPDGYNLIQTATFKNTGLATIRLPSQVRFVEHDAFTGCKQLQSIIVAPHSEIQYVYHRDYDRTRQIDLDIGESAFLGCEKLLAFMAPKTHLVSIWREAFKGCTSLERVAVKLCSHLGDSAFKGCTNLKTVTFYPKVGEAEDGHDLRFTTIGNECFQDCEHLEAIEVPDSVGSIYESAFRACHRLKTVTLPPIINEVAVKCFKECFALEEIEIPHHVTTIQLGAFDLCRSLRKVTFGRGPNNEPPRLDLICAFAFRGCNNIEEFVLPASVTRVSNSAFPIDFVEQGRVTEAARPKGSRRINYYNHPSSAPRQEHSRSHVSGS